jgi:hypothetical protein
MKRALPAICALSLAMAQAFAGEFNSEPAVTAYWQIPLAASKTGKNRQAFGLRFDQTVRDNTGNLVSSFSAPLKPAVMDFRFNDKGLRNIYVHGVNMTSPTILRAAEAGGASAWAVPAFVGGAVLMILLDDDGDSVTGGEG